MLYKEKNQNSLNNTLVGRRKIFTKLRNMKFGFHCNAYAKCCTGWHIKLTSDPDTAMSNSVMIPTQVMALS
jgi:hypothetical protein